MALRSGVTGFIYVNTGTDGSPVWTKVAAQRNLTLNREMETIDVTHKDSNQWREFLASFRSWALDFDGLVEETDGGYDRLKAMYESQLKIKVQVLLPDGATTLTGYGILTALGVEMPMDDAYSFSASIQGSGPLTEA